MDLYCPVCTEPVDNDSIHEEARATAMSYVTVLRDFQARGCVAVGFGDCEPVDSEDRLVIQAMNDLLGDDSDGIMAMMEDYYM